MLLILEAYDIPHKLVQSISALYERDTT